VPRIRIDQVLYICVKVLLPASLISLVGNAVWIALVKQPVNDLDSNPSLVHWGHLVSPEPTIQYYTQIILMVIGLTAIIACLLVVLHAFLTRAKHPPRTMFADVMPVGNQISFTTSKSRD